ncbi:MAG: hypothetical protein ACKO8U_07800, partial [Pirellula sp.]
MQIKPNNVWVMTRSCIASCAFIATSIASKAMAQAPGASGQANPGGSAKPSDASDDTLFEIIFSGGPL